MDSHIVGIVVVVMLMAQGLLTFPGQASGKESWSFHLKTWLGI